MNDPLLYVLASVFGGVAGVALKGAFDWLRSRSGDSTALKIKQIDVATELRKEMREELVKLREELRQVSGEVDRWREEYYAVLQENIQLKSDIERIETEYKQEIEELREEIRQRDEMIESLRERLRKLEGKNEAEEDVRDGNEQRAQ
jgi:chromosome segregation ATPase